MSLIAIVGSAEVVIRAIGDKLEGDIQSALNRAAKGSRGAGKNAGREFGTGVGDGVSEHNLADDLNLPKRDVDRKGDEIGKRLGDQIGKGVQKSRMRGTILKTFLKLSVIIPVIGALVGGLSTLVEGLFAVTAAAGTASSALIVFPGILAAIGAGAITAAVAFKGVGAAITAGFNPDKAKQFQQQLSRLPIAAQAFVKEFVKMREEFRGIQAAAAEGLFDGPNGLTAQLEKLEPLLPKIAGGFRATGQALSEGIGSAFQRLTTDNALENLGIVASTNNHVLRELGKVFGNLGAIILAVLSAASPVIVQFSEWLTDLTQRIRETSEVGAGNNTLTRYFLVAAETAKVFIDIIKNISEGLHDIGKIAFPFGLDLALNLRTATQALADFTDKKENVDRIAVAFGNIHDNTLAISGLIKELGAAFLRLGTGEGVGNIANSLKAIVPDIENLLSASLTAAPAVISLVGSVAQLLATLSSSGVLTVFATALKAVVETFNFVAEAVPGAKQAFAGLLITFTAMKVVSFLAAPVLLFGKSMTLASIAATAFKNVMWLVNLALDANPIGATIAILLALAAAFKYAWGHSETFRKIVVAMAKAIITYFQFMLTAWSKILGALSGIPVIGKYADAASKKMKSFSGSLDGAKNSLDGLVKRKPKIDLDPKLAYEKLKALKASGDFVLNGKLDLDTAEAALKLRALAAVVALPFQGAPLLKGLDAGSLIKAANTLSQRSRPSDSSSIGGGGATGSDSPTPKAEKKKKEPKPPVVNFAPVLKAVGQSGEKFRSALDSFISSLDKTKDKEAIAQANAFKKRFEPFLKAFDTVTDKIKKFGETVLEVQKSLIEKANPFAGDGGSDISSIVSGLQDNQQKIADFAKAVRDLRGAGLNNDTLQQFVAAGPDGLAKAASILRSGPNGIAEINKLAGQVRNNARAAGKESAASGLGAGKLTADGFIEGLKNQKKKLQSQLNELAVGMGQTLAKTLGKSAELRHFPDQNPKAKLPTKTAKATTVNSSNSIKVTQIYNGPTTGSSRNKELDWTLRYSSPTASDASAGGNSPVGVER